VSKLISLIVGAILIACIGGFVYWQKQQALQRQTMQEVVQEGQTREQNTQQGTYTLADVAQHNDASSCWSVINGTVYDLTSWIPQHPGGERAILQLCGTDGSAKFNNQHGGREPMISILAGFKIGAISQ
jgi:cytochrome b involved in lipid metabolism